jgi:hypothetical protein
LVRSDVAGQDELAVTVPELDLHRAGDGLREGVLNDLAVAGAELQLVRPAPVLKKVAPSTRVCSCGRRISTLAGELWCRGQAEGDGRPPKVSIPHLGFSSLIVVDV